MENLTALSRAELLALKQQLDGEIVKIKMQLEQARLTKVQTGQYADREWYLRANRALRIKGLDSQAIQNELTRRKETKRHPPMRPDSLPERFIAVARQRLPPEMFAGILSEAQDDTPLSEQELR